MSSADKVALVTGASRGIGQAIALELGKSGLIVIGTATSEEGAKRISELFAEFDIKGTGMCLDVTSDESVKSVIAQINETYSAPQILVNNAGITRDSLLMRMSVEDWEDVLNTNLTSIYRLSKACLRGMTKARKGRIVNISSVVASMGNAGQCNYSAAKAGLEGFTRSLAQEIGVRNITVNAVAPGFIETDMTSEMTEEQRKALIDKIPLDRIGKPSDIANLVAFLCSEAASYITGETIHVNGGMYAG